MVGQFEWKMPVGVVPLNQETLMCMEVENNDYFQSTYKPDLYNVVNVT